MSSQATFSSQPLHVKTNVSTANCTTPLEAIEHTDHYDNAVHITDTTDLYMPLPMKYNFDDFVGALRFSQQSFDDPHEIHVYHTTTTLNPEHDNHPISTWTVLWVDSGQTFDFLSTHQTVWHTSSLQHATDTVLTLTTALRRVNTEQPHWVDSVRSVTGRVQRQQPTTYMADWNDARHEHPPWSIRRGNIHITARAEYNALKQRREEAFQSALDEFDNNDNPHLDREVLPPQPDCDIDDAIEQFLADDIDINELENELEIAWGLTNFVPFDDYLQQCDQIDSETEPSEHSDDTESDVPPLEGQTMYR